MAFIDYKISKSHFFMPFLKGADMENIINENKVVETTTPPSYMHKVGNITYKVNVHFNEKSSETIDDKIKRMILEDCNNPKNILGND